MGKGCGHLRRFVLCLAWGLAAVPAFGAMCQVQDAIAAGGRIWALCGRERIYSTADAGQSWQSVDLPPDVLYRALAFPDERRGFIVGDAGTLLVTEDGGKTWSRRELPTKENLMDISVVKDRAWIVGQNGTVLHSPDGGKSWVQQKTGIPQGLASVHFVDENNGWAVGWMGVVLRTRDAGKTWEPVKIADASWSLSFVYFQDAKTGWITGMFGQMLFTQDGGENWRVVNVPTKGTITSVYRASDGRLLATTGNDLLVSKDGGGKWESLDINQWLFFKRIVPAGTSLWAVGTFHILSLDPAKNQWVRLANTPSSQT